MSQVNKLICDNCNHELIARYNGSIELMCTTIDGQTKHIAIKENKDFCSIGCIIEEIINQVNREQGEGK